MTEASGQPAVEKREKGKLTAKQLIMRLVAVIMILTAAVLFGIYRWLTVLLPTQQEAERWQGDGEVPFSQVSCFLPADGQIKLSNVNTFRNAAMKALTDASLDVNGEQQLMLDCWSTTAKQRVSSDHGRGDAAVVAVGGSFFDFHPLRLLSGDYIRQSDLMEDRVLLDENLAWLLFGGTDLAGLEIKIGNQVFIVAGVVEREQDPATKRVYSDELGLFMRYDALLKLDADAGISCYEYVLVQPVKNFAVNLAREKFPIGRGVIVCNTERYGYEKLMKLMLRVGERSIQNSGVLFPYWENAARVTEDWSGVCCLLGSLLLVFPGILLLIGLVKAAVAGKRALEERILPEAAEKTEEAIRKRQRAQWERRHPDGH